VPVSATASLAATARLAASKRLALAIDLLRPTREQASDPREWGAFDSTPSKVTKLGGTVTAIISDPCLALPKTWVQLTLIVAVPMATPVTEPLGGLDDFTVVTVATDELDEVQAQLTALLSTKVSTIVWSTCTVDGPTTGSKTPASVELIHDIAARTDSPIPTAIRRPIRRFTLTPRGRFEPRLTQPR
jgi:hypothetical protein